MYFFLSSGTTEVGPCPGHPGPVWWSWCSCTPQSPVEDYSEHGSHEITQLQFVQDGGLSQSIYTHHKNRHFFLTKKAPGRGLQRYSPCCSPVGATMDRGTLCGCSAGASAAAQKQTLVLFHVVSLMAEPSIGKARARKLEEDARNHSNCKHVYSLLAGTKTKHTCCICLWLTQKTQPQGLFRWCFFKLRTCAAL